LKRLIFVISMILFIEANDVSSIYKVEGYNSATPIPNIAENNPSASNETMEKDEEKSIEFQSDYDTALAQAKSEDKYIFLLVTEEHCRWCEKLLETSLRDNRVVSKMETDYIAVMVDKNHGYYPSNIGITGVPSVFIINPKNGKIVKDIVGYRDADYYLKWFKYVDTERSLQ